MTLRSNPRLLIFYLILAALPLGGLSLYSRLPQLVGGLVIGVCIFIDYGLFRFARPFLRTKVTTTETTVSVQLPNQEEVFAWEEVTLSGKCLIEGRGGRSFIFLYNLERDRILTVPYEYTDMPGLEKTLSERTPYEVFQLSSAMELQRIIQERYHLNKTEPDEPEKETAT
jgi:hypothetical protein